MTEAEWLACTDLESLRSSLGNQVSTRKLRLFACACCRSLEGIIVDADVRKALEAAERYADGLIRDSTMLKYSNPARRPGDRLPLAPPPTHWFAYPPSPQ